MSSAALIISVSLFALIVTGYLAQSRLPPPRPKIIGIDLGTTFSCVATYESKSGNVTVYKDDNGKRIIPSVVAILDESVLVGYKAVQQIETNSKNTIYDAKRFIGKKYTPQGISKFTSNYPFQLGVDDKGDPHFKVSLSTGVKEFKPEDIGAFILRRLKKMAEVEIDRAIEMAVISVPADFDDAQRNATVQAGAMAGLKILRVISEPTAAALAYGLHKKVGTNTVIVIDFGGGTLDVSLLLVQGGMFITMAMAGNNRLGGQDVNNNLINFFKEMIEKKFESSINIPNDLQIIRDEVEKVKINLTDHREASFSVHLETISPVTNTGIRFEYVLTRDQFNDLNTKLFQKILLPIKRVLKDAEIMREDIDEIVLVGGSTRIPRVREMVAEFFGKVPNTSIDPDIAVGVGVAIQASITGNGWPMKVSAVEIQNRNLTKVMVKDEEDL